MKCKLLLDENISSRKALVRLNSRFNLRHIREDYKKSGILDKEVFEIAEKEGRIIVTFNEAVISLVNTFVSTKQRRLFYKARVNYYFYG